MDWIWDYTRKNNDKLLMMSIPTESEAYLGPCQTSMMELFATIVKGTLMQI